jgi:hypothetical protein
MSAETDTSKSTMTLPALTSAILILETGMLSSSAMLAMKLLAKN